MTNDDDLTPPWGETHMPYYDDGPPIIDPKEARRRDGPCSMRDDGLYFTNAKGFTTRIAWPEFKVVARTSTQAGLDVGVIIQWKGERDTDQEYEVRKADLVEGRGLPLIKELMRRNLTIHTNFFPTFICYLGQQSHA